MCDPVSLALMTIAATGASAVGSIKEGNAKRRAADAQADLNEQQAGRELEIAALNAERDEEEGALLLGKQIALASAQGGAANAGSNLLVQRQTAGRTQLNKELAMMTGRDKATTLRANASQTRDQGRSDQTSGQIQALGTAVKGAKKTDFKAITTAFG